MRCTGCLKRFKNSAGLWRHLSHSLSANCKTIYIAQKNYLPTHVNNGGNPPSLPTTSKSAVPLGPGNHISTSTACRTDANDTLEPSNLSRSDDLPGNEGPGDDFPWLSDSEEHGPLSSEDDGDIEDNEYGGDHGDWIDETGPGDAHPEIAADITHDDIRVNQTPALNQAQQAEIEQSQTPDLRLEIVQFGGMAGKPVQTGGPTAGGVYQGKVGQGDQPANLYAPFSSQIDWEFAKWAKLRGPTSTAVTDLLNIPGVSPQVYLILILAQSAIQVHESLGLSYKTSKDLNTIVDKLPGRPKFKKSEVMVAGEPFDVYHRDILECIQALIGDPEFVGELKLAPERHYTDKDCLNRVYSDAHTGKWWWKVQVCASVTILLTMPNLLCYRLHWRKSSLVQQSSQFLSLLIKPSLHSFEGR